MRRLTVAALGALGAALVSVQPVMAQAVDGARCIPLQQRWDAGVPATGQTAFRNEILNSGLSRTCPRLLAQVNAAIASRDQAARDQAAREQAARDQAAREQAARDQAARDQAARDQAARDQAARDQAARDQAARDQAARDQAARRAAASFVDARSTPAGTRAPLVTNPSSLPDYALFRECEGCPEMVVIPAGSFTMGSPASEAGRDSDEGPQVSVRVPRFAIARFETTWDEWAACVSAGVCQQREDSGFGRGRRPVNVDWETDTRAFVGFVNSRASGYRLPSEAEWEYAARAGTTSAFPWGSTASRDYANYGSEQCCSGQASGADQWVNTSPVGSLRANPFGLYDMHGNVREWVEDCYRNTLSGQTAAAYTTEGCSSRVLRGGSWYLHPEDLRSAFRGRYNPAFRVNDIGFRLARTL
jgi:formylglycine-generating enzyme required for sulfatase activity